MTRSSRTRRGLIVVACAALLASGIGGTLSGCGQKSALYLPQKKKSKVPPDPSNPDTPTPDAPAANAP